jgi:hypothetical protein
MKFAFAAILAAVAIARPTRDERRERRQARWNEIEELVNDKIEWFGETQDWLVNDVKPEIEDFRTRSDDLNSTVEDQMKWDDIESFEDFQANYDEADWDKIYEKVKAMDKKGKVNWDHVEERYEMAQEKIEQAQEKKEHHQKKAEEHRKKFEAKRERVEAKLDQVNDKVNKHVEKVNKKLNRIDFEEI